MEVVDSEGAKKRGGFPDAAYVLIADKGYEIRDDVDVAPTLAGIMGVELPDAEGRDVLR